MTQHSSKRNRIRLSLPLWIILTWCVGLLICSGYSYAQTPSESPRIITLETAWELAAEHNKDLQIAQENVTVADGQVREAWSAALPTLSASGQYQRSFEPSVFYITSIDPDNGQETTQALKIGNDNAYTGILQVQQPLWVAGKIGLGLKAARLYRKVSQEALKSSGIDLRYYVAQDFFGILLTNALYKVTEESFELSKQHAQQVHSLFEQGLVSEYDVLRADVQVANQEPNLIQVRNQVKLAEIAMKSRLGIDLDSEVEFQGELIPIDIEPLSVDQAYRSALEHHPGQEILNLQKQLNQIQYTAQNRNLYWPNFYLSADATWQTQASDYDIGDYSWNRSVSAYLQVSIPLFDGLKTKAQKQQVRAKGRQLLHQEMQFHDGLRLQLQAILDDIRTAQERLNAQEQTVDQADRAMEIAEVRYQSGISTLLEVMDAQLALQMAKTEYLQAVYDQRIAIFALERALGQLGLTPKEPEDN